MLDYNHPDPEVRGLVASAEDTPTEVLQKLSKDSILKFAKQWQAILILL